MAPARSRRPEVESSAASRWNVAPIDAETVDAPTPPVTEELSTASAGVFVPAPTGETTSTVTRRAGGRHLFTWVGAHGGAGVTSLAAGSGQGADLTKAWPAPELGWPSAVALVCRSNAAGLDAAARLIQEVIAGTVDQVELVGLIVVADAPGRLPRALRNRVHELGGLVPTVVDVPWIMQWRETPYTAHAAASAAAERIADQLRASREGES